MSLEKLKDSEIKCKKVAILRKGTSPKLKNLFENLCCILEKDMINLKVRRF